MKRQERMSAFKAFYLQTYKDTMHYFLKQTGDFLNAEDFLSRVYSDVYLYFIKAKAPAEEGAASCLQKCSSRILKQCLQKHQKNPKQPSASQPIEEFELLLERELALEEATVEKQMLRQELLSYVSQKPLLVRRLFAYVFYFGNEIEETAAKLKISVAAAKEALSALIAELEEQYLIDFEQDVEE